MAALNTSGFSRPIDILALQESVYHTGTTANPTAQGFANVLNAIYGANTYAVASLNGTTTGATGGGACGRTLAAAARRSASVART